jgi:hypothetical protein
VPEFGALYQTGESVWQGAGCSWAAFAEVARSGPDERPMLHSERGICAPDGTLLGAIVLHLIPDYRALPFVSTANPYDEVLGNDARPRAGSSIADLQTVVYGWSLHPVFVSGRVAWQIDPEIDQLLYRSRVPFWRDRMAGDRLYHIYFLNDRAAVYALGYPSPTALQHVLSGRSCGGARGLFVVSGRPRWLAPLWRGGPAALGKLFFEIRASFYGFSVFVLAAVGPVALRDRSAVTTARPRDVESEAASVVIVARRVFDELSARRRVPDRLGRHHRRRDGLDSPDGRPGRNLRWPQLAAASDLFDSACCGANARVRLSRHRPERRPCRGPDQVDHSRPRGCGPDSESRLQPRHDTGRAACVPPARIEREIDELTWRHGGTVLLVVSRPPWCLGCGARLRSGLASPGRRASSRRTTRRAARRRRNRRPAR